MRLTPEHTAIAETTRRFVETEINPFADEWEKAGIWPAHEILGKMGKLGLLGIQKSSDYGGQDLDYSYQAAFLEALGTGRANGASMGISVQTDMATPALAKFGSDELRQEFLAPAITGEYVASIAVSEPQAGSDVARLKTNARKDGGDYVINGAKMWITNSTQADFFCLLANTSEEGGPYRNKSLIVVPSKTKGISFSEKLNKLGMRSSDTAQVFFDDVRVPQRFLIGEEGLGFTLQMKQFQEERLAASLLQLGTLDVVIDETLAYVKERVVFEKPLIDNQVVQFRLAELKTELEAVRALCWRAVEALVEGENVTTWASMAKLKIGRVAREVTDSCLQYFGGNGFMWDNFVTRCYRDLRLTSIGGGADEVMLQVIAKELGYSSKRR
jgi:citronellyl-CoA dehydrogenase